MERPIPTSWYPASRLFRFEHPISSMQPVTLQCNVQLDRPTGHSSRHYGRPAPGGFHPVRFFLNGRGPERNIFQGDAPSQLCAVRDVEDQKEFTGAGLDQPQ
jgi:hypothetical protein